MNVMSTGLMMAQRFLDQDQDLAFSFEGAAEEFVVVDFSAHEAVNSLFEIHLQLASHDSDIDLHALMDTSATLTVHHKYDELRHLSGIISECERGDSGTRRTFYSLTLRSIGWPILPTAVSGRPKTSLISLKTFCPIIVSSMWSGGWRGIIHRASLPASTVRQPWHSLND